MIQFFRKYHKWISVVFTLFIILFAVSGIILNHRKLLSGIDVNRKLLPDEYAYKNWNNAAVKSTLKLSNDSILIYGNIGIWLTDSVQSQFTDFNKGFPQGIDNRKIEKLFRSKNNTLLAGTLFGLYQYSFGRNKWRNINLPIHEKRIVDIIQKNDTILVLSRSHLLKTTNLTDFDIITLPNPENYDHKVGLFKTLWVIHSGEIYGETGKILVDILGLILTFLAISGIVVFINRIQVKNPKTPVPQKVKKLKTNKWFLKWHNKLGWITLVILIITPATGIFLRPPFLIPIADKKVDKIRFSELDTNNAWFDQLRRILYDAEKDRFLVATSEALYYSDDNFQSELKKFAFQPPLSVMGVNVFKKLAPDTYLIGSFEGLFVWNAVRGITVDYIKKEFYKAPEKKSRPLGQFMVTAYSNDFYNSEIYFDYNSGAQTISGNPFSPMPEKIAGQPISLWNTALEIHTGRIFQSILGDFYILIVPLTGLSLLFILISGFVVWFKLFRKNSKKQK
jgi:hypothetical protein